MHATSPPPPVRTIGNGMSLLLAFAVSLPWTVCALSGVHPSDPIVAGLAGISILGAAFLLSWAVETAEIDLPQALAVSVLALVAVLPEYAVDATFAWKAAHDPAQAGYAVANMTGGNRLLLGLGWSSLAFIAWGRFGKPGIRMPETTRIDVAVLMMASVYALVPVARGRITLVDTAVFVTMYIVYVVAATRAGSAAEKAGEHEEEEELVGPSALLGLMPDMARRTSLIAILLWSAGVIFLAAEPFAEALVHSGLQWGIDEFLLVQWVAPLASEAPEFAVAALLVFRGRLAKGMLTLVSSKVNQWTLLIGTLPLVTSISAGQASHLALDARQAEEVLLTAAQSVFGVAVLANLHLTRIPAIVLAVLFLGQLAVPSTEGRHLFSLAYLAAAGGILTLHGPSRRGLVASLQMLGRTLFRRRAAS